MMDTKTRAQIELLELAGYKVYECHNKPCIELQSAIHMPLADLYYNSWKEFSLNVEFFLAKREEFNRGAHRIIKKEPVRLVENQA